MHRAARQRVSDILSLQIDRKAPHEIKSPDPGLFLRFTPSGLGHSHIIDVDMAAELEPEPHLAMQREEHLLQVAGQDEAARRDVLSTPIAVQRVAARD